MADVLEYVLSLQDQMSSKLQKIGISSDTALNKFSKLQKQSKETKELLNSMGGSVGSLKAKLDLLRQERDWIPQSQVQNLRKYNTEIKNLEKEISRLETINGSRTKRWFNDAFSSLPFGNLITNPLVLAGAAGAKAISLGIEAEMQSTSFEVMLGGKEAAKGLIDDIADYAKKTPYSKMGLGDATKTMLGFGVAQEKVMPNLRMLGDVAMGDANKLSSLTLAFSQISAAGKLQGQDLLQLINVGFNPLQVISKQTGKSMVELRDEMSKGNISFQMVEDAFKSATSEGGQFFNMSERMSQTFGGKLSTLMDEFNERLLSLFNVLSAILMPAMEFLLWLIDAIGGLFGYFVKKVKEGNPIFIALAVVIGSVTTALTLMKIGTMLQATWSGILTLGTNLLTKEWWSLNAAMWANPITWIIALVVALIAVIAYLIYAVEDWGAVWDNHMKFMKAQFSMVAATMSVAWMGFKNTILDGIDAIKKGWYSLKALWDKDGAQKALQEMNKASNERKKALFQETQNFKVQTYKVGYYAIKTANSMKLKSFGEVKDNLMNDLGLGTPQGIENPKVPGIDKANLVDDLSLDKVKDKGSKTNESIATGGTKTTHIEMTFKNIVETIHVSGKDFKEAAADLERQVQDAMLRTIAMVNMTAQ